MTVPLPPIAEIAARLGGEVRSGEVQCPGPGHSAQDRSLSVKLDKDAYDGFIVHSFAGDDPIICRDHVRTKLGLPPFEPKKKKKNGSDQAWTFVAEHVYRTEANEPYLRIQKYRDGTGKKQFLQSHWDGCRWVSGKPEGAKVPYRLPELVAAPPGSTVYIFEGERCADAAARLGFVSTTNSEGADTGNGKKWTPELNEWFRDRNVVIVADNDLPGRKHVQHVAKNLQGFAKTVRVLDLALHWPGEAMPVGHDVVEWFEVHDRVGSRLAQLAKDEALWEAGADDGSREGARGSAKDPGDGRSGRSKQADLLIDLAQSGALLFHDVEGTGYAKINLKGHGETWPVRSSGFRRWLLWSYYKKYRGAPNAEAMTAALGMIEAKAVFEGTEQRVFVRVGHSSDGKLYLDLCDDKWRAIEIDTAGWGMIDSPPIRFIRSRGMLPLPSPQKDGSIEKLGSLINVKSAQDFTLIIAWLLATLRDRGPFPVLVVTGQHGSAKSTLLEILRRLIDPNVANLRAPPKDPDDLYITATLSHIVPYDNLSAIPHWLSDALARIATGTAYAKRKLYTDVDEVLLCAEKPIALNGITEIVGAADLGDRSLFIVAQPIDPKERRPESEIWNRFDREHPAILGALLDAVVHGLRTLPTVTDVEWPRMADFAMWATACEGAYAKQGTFKTAYAGNRADAIGAMIEGDVVASAVLRFALPWSGQLATLLEKLAAVVGDVQARARPWPKSPRGLGSALRRAAPLLAEQGVTVSPPPPQDRTRTWKISLQQPEQPGPADFANNSIDLSSSNRPGYCRFEDPQQPYPQAAAKPSRTNGSGDLGDLGCSAPHYSAAGARGDAADGPSPPPNPWRRRL